MSDKQRFSKMMEDLGTLYDKDVTSSLKRLYWDDLGQIAIEHIEAAASAHRRDPDRGRFFPKPADLLARLPRKAVMSADEAWSLCLASFDESDTAITCEAIDAGRAAALPVFEMGDAIGARMAFKSAYDRAMAGGQHQTWRLSVGWDRAKREQAAERAVTAGWLSHDAVRDYLPAPAVTPEGAAIAGLLTGNVVPIRGVDEVVRARLAEVRAMLLQQGRPELMPEEQERFEARKRKEIDRLQSMQKRVGSDK